MYSNYLFNSSLAFTACDNSYLKETHPIYYVENDTRNEFIYKLQKLIQLNNTL